MTNVNCRRTSPSTAAVRWDGHPGQRNCWAGPDGHDHRHDGQRLPKDGAGRLGDDDHERLGQHDRAARPLTPGTTLQNGVQYGGVGVNAGAGGTISGSTIYGSGYGNASDQSTAVLLCSGRRRHLDQDTITGDGTDIGVAVAANSTGVIVDRNRSAGPPPTCPTVSGSEWRWTPGRAATVTCNTFSGWKTDLVRGSAAATVHHDD